MAQLTPGEENQVRLVDIPMLAILIGAIGGMIMGGLVGLFVGSVVVALAYKMISMMMED